MGVLPSKKDLAEAVMKVLSETEEPMQASAINDAVASLLKIPEDILAIESTSSMCSEFDYQMRWVRTDLKKKGKLANPSRGLWKVI